MKLSKLISTSALCESISQKQSALLTTRVRVVSIRVRVVSNPCQGRVKSVSGSCQGCVKSEISHNVHVLAYYQAFVLFVEAT